MKREVLGVALCGGSSSRMGQDKATLEIRPGVSQLEYVLELLEPFCLKRAISFGERTRFVDPSLLEGVEVIADAVEVAGPMAGALAALRHAEGWPVLLVACDMPFLEARHLVQLLNRRNPEKLVTAFVGSDGVPDPMCAVYEPAARLRLEALATEGRSSLRRFLVDGPTELVAPDEPEFLASVNDPEALRVARRHFGKSK